MVLFSLLFVALSLTAGWQIVRQLPMTFHRLEAAAYSVVIGFVVTAWTTFILAVSLGFVIGLPLAIVLLLLFSVLIQFATKTRCSITTEPYSRRLRWLAWAIGGSIGVLLVVLTYLSYQFPAADGSWITNGNVYGDGPLHVSLANQFALGDSVDLVSAVYQKSPLTYPFLSDFYSGILRRLGADWQLAMTLPSALMIMSLAQLLFSAGYRLLHSAIGAWLQLLMLLFGGSFHGGLVLAGVLLAQGMVAYNEKIGNSIAFATGDQYLNIVHSHFLPQRSYLFGMALFMVAMSIALELYRGFGKKVSLNRVRVAAVIVGMCVGSMPMVHMHSFLIIGALLGLSTALLLIRRRLPNGWLLMIVSALTVATPQLIWQLGHSLHGHFISFISGWMMQDFSPVNDMNIVLFWFGQLGLLLVTMFTGWYWLRRYSAKAEIWLLYVSAIAVFVLCNVISFQPSLWDNMKLFNYAFWFLMVVTAFIFTQWWSHRLGRIAAVIGMISLCLYGFLTLGLSGPQLNFELMSKKDVAFGERLQSETPIDAYILVGDRHSHPVTMLSDRKVLISYSGWFNLYGAEWEQVVADRDAMLQGVANTQDLVSRYGLTHAVFNDGDVMQGTVNLDYYLTHYRLVSHDFNWWVFDLGSYL